MMYCYDYEISNENWKSEGIVLAENARDAKKIILSMEEYDGTKAGIIKLYNNSTGKLTVLNVEVKKNAVRRA